METRRYYLHGDVLEDGERFYDARADAFIPISKLGEVSVLDIERYKLMAKDLKRKLEKGRPIGADRWVRPPDAKNLFEGHELLKLHPVRLQARIRKARFSDERKLRTDDE